MKKYRIVSNGLNFRIQWLKKTWILRRLKWYWLKVYCGEGVFISEFSSKEKAQDAIKICVKKNKAKKQGYIPT